MAIPKEFVFGYRVVHHSNVYPKRLFSRGWVAQGAPYTIPDLLGTWAGEDYAVSCGCLPQLIHDMLRFLWTFAQNPIALYSRRVQNRVPYLYNNLMRIASSQNPCTRHHHHIMELYCKVYVERTKLS